MDLCIPKVVILLYSKGKVSPLAGLSFLRTSFVEGDRETGGERGGAGEEGQEAEFPRWREAGEMGEITQHCVTFPIRKSAKRWEPTNVGRAGTGIKKREV